MAVSAACVLNKWFILPEEKRSSLIKVPVTSQNAMQFFVQFGLVNELQRGFDNMYGSRYTTG